MTTLKNLRGKTIQNFTSDPSDDTEGQVWYNTTAGAFKSVVGVAAWSSASPLGSARYALAKGTTGSQSSALAALGRLPSSSQTGITEEYNGSGWETGGTANTARYGSGGFGIVTAFVAAGGAPLQQTVEEYNGSTWTTGTSFPTTARFYLAGFGTESAGAITGGATTTPVDTAFTTTDEYNGSSWTAGGNLNTGGARLATTGTQTAGIAATRGILPFITASGAAEQYDGTSWTNITSVNTARYNAAGFGTQTSMIVCGGTPSPTATENWNGSTWTNTTALGTGRNTHSAGGNSGSAGLVFGGNPPGIANTEEYNFSTNVITAAAWASGGNYPTATADLAGLGTQTATLGAGGSLPPGSTTANSVEYDGTSWGSPSTLNTSRSFITGFGTQTAGVVFGAAPAAALTGATELYNGSTWTTSGPLATARGNAGRAGIQTAGLGFGGYIPPATPSNSSNATEEFNGSTWGPGGNLNTARRGLGGSGTQTAALAAGGRAGATVSSTTEEYDGTSWTSVNNMLYASDSFRMGGTQTATLGGGGYGTPLAPTGSQAYDGTTWFSQPTLGTGVRRGAGDGTQTVGILFAGDLAPGTQTVEFTGETTAANVKTVTTS